jgi:RNA polymerase sigma factor (sigma-70 family)
VPAPFGGRLSSTGEGFNLSTLALAHKARQAAVGRTDATDEDLVAAARRGDNDAFGQLFGRYHKRIGAYVARMIGDAQHAEEIAQEAFISAMRRMRESGQEIIFRPWIYGIARNAAIDHLRARSRRGREVAFDVVEAAGTYSERLVSGHLAPEAAVESKQALADLQGAFGGLSELHHQILVMRELEGLSYAQIGTRLGLSRASVESMLFRARRRLEEEYEQLASGERCASVRATIAGGTERPLGTRDATRVRRHLSHCRDCRREVQRARVAAPIAA